MRSISRNSTAPTLLQSWAALAFSSFAFLDSGSFWVRELLFWGGVPKGNPGLFLKLIPLTDPDHQKSQCYSFEFFLGTPQKSWVSLWLPVGDHPQRPTVASIPRAGRLGTPPTCSLPAFDQKRRGELPQAHSVRLPRQKTGKICLRWFVDCL